MDNSAIYQYRFDELLGIVKGSREKEPLFFEMSENEKGEFIQNAYYSTDSNRLTESDIGPVIDICGNAFREYQRLVSHNESWAIYTIERIVIGLFEQLKITYSIPEFKTHKSNGRVAAKHPFAFSAKSGCKNVGYVFLFRLQHGLRFLRENYNKLRGIDEVRFCFLQDDNQQEISFLNDIEKEEDKGFLQFISLKELFHEYFGEREYTLFLSYARKFNERAKSIIGFKTIPMPTTGAIQTFKAKKEEQLRSIDYEKKLPSSLSAKQKRIIIDNYINRELFRVMTGNDAFADSFISSEWYYAIHTVTGAIDQTGLVTGYLKSVEQLLYALIKLSFSSGKKRRIDINKSMQSLFQGRIFNDRFIEFSRENEAYADTTLGSLLGFIKNKSSWTDDFYNKDLFVVDSETIQAIVDRLYVFKDFERNDRLHKDNLYSKEEVDDIRDQALAIYCLLLGSFKIQENDLITLSGMSNNEKVQQGTECEKDLYNQIKEWASPILQFDMPKEARIVAFFVGPLCDGTIELWLQGIEEIPRDKYDAIDWNHRQLYSSSYTKNTLTLNDIGTYQDAIGAILTTLRRLIEDDSVISTQLKAHQQVVVGGMKVIEILYSK